MSVYQVITTCHGTPGLQLIGGNDKHHRFVRRAVSINYIYHQAYILNRDAGAFIQGQSDNPMWTLIEFWGKDYQPFVNWLNENIEQEISDKRVSKGEM